MQIKEAILNNEKELVKEFLNKFDLKYADDIDKTFYLEDDNKIVGTISISSYIIKDLAVDLNYQGENLAGILINEALNYFRINNIFSYQVFTKAIYEETFKSLGFRVLVKTDKLVMLEGGISSIDEEIKKIKNVLELNFSTLDENTSLAAVVLNANPITNGHVHLIEEAKKKYNNVVVFIVEEDKSVFSFKERLSLAYLATRRLSNVYVMASTKYIVSSLTFPDYFLKSESEKIEENAKVDALIFKNYFMKELHIKKRFVGSEESSKMQIYNQTLKEILGDKLEIIDRLKEDGEIISAKKVRALLEEGKIDEALKYCPNECSLVLRSIAMVKYGSK